MVIHNYSVYDFSNHPGPLFGFIVYVPAVEIFLYGKRVIETAHLAELFDQIYAETLVTVVALQRVAGQLHHAVRFRLRRSQHIHVIIFGNSLKVERRRSDNRVLTNEVITTKDMFLKSNSCPAAAASESAPAETLIPVFAFHVPVTLKPFCVKSTSSNSMSVRNPSWSNLILPVSPLKSF